jgi:tetratricopeptide (TPR) repeat protein
MRLLSRRPTRLLVALALVGGLVASATSQSRSPAQENLEKWLAAVASHRPGSLDQPARAIAFWPWKVLEPVLELARRLEDSDPLLRAAVLYLDVAFHVSRSKRPAYPTQGRVLRMKDGTPAGVDVLDSHVWWARHLVDEVVKDKDVTQHQLDMALRWYQATSAILAGRLELADQRWHLEDARVLFPDDAVLLLDQGCLEETLGSPMIQQATARYVASNPAAVQGQRRERFPSAGENLRTAEDFFRQSIAAADSGEARVRLGWVLTQRGRSADAVPQLEAATTDPDDAIRYFGWLFLGHVRARQSEWSQAITAYRAALEIFPEAQAAHLGLSRVAAEQGVAADARKWLAGLGTEAALLHDDLSDPWWRYTWCRGRDYERLHAEYAKGVAGGAR